MIPQNEAAGQIFPLSNKNSYPVVKALVAIAAINPAPSAYRLFISLLCQGNGSTVTMSYSKATREGGYGLSVNAVKKAIAILVELGAIADDSGDGLSVLTPIHPSEWSDDDDDHDDHDERSQVDHLAENLLENLLHINNKNHKKNKNILFNGFLGEEIGNWLKQAIAIGLALGLTGSVNVGEIGLFAHPLHQGDKNEVICETPDEAIESGQDSSASLLNRGVGKEGSAAPRRSKKNDRDHGDRPKSSVFIGVEDRNHCVWRRRKAVPVGMVPLFAEWFDEDSRHPWRQDYEFLCYWKQCLVLRNNSPAFSRWRGAQIDDLYAYRAMVYDEIELVNQREGRSPQNALSTPLELAWNRYQLGYVPFDPADKDAAAITRTLMTQEEKAMSNEPISPRYEGIQLPPPPEQKPSFDYSRIATSPEQCLDPKDMEWIGRLSGYSTHPVHQEPLGPLDPTLEDRFNMVRELNPDVLGKRVDCSAPDRKAMEARNRRSSYGQDAKLLAARILREEDVKKQAREILDRQPIVSLPKHQIKKTIAALQRDEIDRYMASPPPSSPPPSVVRRSLLDPVNMPEP